MTSAVDIATGKTNYSFGSLRDAMALWKTRMVETAVCSTPREKVRFTRRFKHQLLDTAKLATPRQKMMYTLARPDYHAEMGIWYPQYLTYNQITTEKEDQLNKFQGLVNQMKPTEMSDDDDEDFVPEDHFEKDELIRWKRLNKILRKYKKRLKYRTRDKNYFDNYLVNDWIACYNATQEQVFADLICDQVDLIIVRQIKRKRFHQFSTLYDDLLQEVRLACLTSLGKFDPSKGKPGRESFNWFSHICIKAGHMITLRKSGRDKIETPDSDIVSETLSFQAAPDEEDHMINQIMTGVDHDALSVFYEYFHEYFKGRERMQLLLQILIYYVLDIRMFGFKKNEFVRYSKSYGFAPAYVNKFLGIVRSHKAEFSKDSIVGIM